MKIRTLVKSLLPQPVLEMFHRAGIGIDAIDTFAFDGHTDVKTDIVNKYGFEGDLLDIFVGNKGSIVHKWHHYIPIYDRYFSSFRGRKFRFLEIGVSKGGSLKMWRKYFGDDAVIFGIDINPECKQFDGIHGQVRIGSQDDIDFLKSVIDEMGGVDVILDDGSHVMGHIIDSFKFLFPKMNNGGIYMIEDLHTAFWSNYGGRYGSPSNVFSFLSDIVNDMHHWYHANGVTHPEVSSICSGIHVHDSIAVLEKNAVYPPTHSQIG